MAGRNKHRRRSQCTNSKDEHAAMSFFHANSDYLHKRENAKNVLRAGRG